MNKARSQTKHAKRRAFERYGLELTAHQLREIGAMIRSGRAEFVEKQSHRVSVFRVPIGATTARVVYDRNRKTIVTFLPPD